VPPADDPVDCACGSGRPQDELGRTLACRDRAIRARDRLESSRDGGSHRDHSAPRTVSVVDEPCSLRGHSEALGRRQLFRLERGHARMQQHRSEDDSFRNELGHELVRERPPCSWHLGTPRLASKDRLVSGEVPATPRIPIGDRAAVAGEVLLHRAAS
jgi:hypothetical protein